MYTPKYSITNKILKHVGIIEACKEIVDHAPLLPYYEKEFQKTHWCELCITERILRGMSLI